MAEVLFSLSNPVFKDFVWYTTVVVLKLLAMAPLTARHRFAKGAFMNKEDAVGTRDKKPILNDPDVERVRRCHLNDIENIFPFVLLGLMYISTGPAASTALWHFRAFVISRFCHTVAYLCAIPQPARVLAFMVGMAANISMGIRTLSSIGFF